MRPNASGTLVIVTSYLLGAQGIEAKIDETAQTEAYYELNPTTGARLFDANNNYIVAYRGVTSWYIYDGHGNVVGTVNGVTGAYTANPTLDVYGVARASGAAATKQGYCGSLGHVTDDTGLVYMKARYYDPNVGRFASQDPSGNGINWYVYANDNPTTNADKTGKVTINHVMPDSNFAEAAFDAYEEGGLEGLADFLDAEWGYNVINFSKGSNPGIVGRFQIQLDVNEDLLESLCSDDAGEFGMNTGFSVDAERILSLINGASSGEMADMEASDLTSSL
jgi:RHS repeat-associated protein